MNTADFTVIRFGVYSLISMVMQQVFLIEFSSFLLSLFVRMQPVFGVISWKQHVVIQSNLYKSATFGSGLNWLLYRGVCLIKVESEMS